jgi:WD40 repeat protein
MRRRAREGGLGGGGETQRTQRLIWDVAVSPDGRYVVSGGWGDTTRVWSLPSGDMLQSHAATDQSVQGVAFLPDSKHFVSSSQRDGTVYVRETEGGLDRAALRNYSGRDVAVHPGGEMLAATSGEGVRVFRLNLALPTDAEVERYQQIIARLEDDDVRVRDAASAEILAIGLPIELLLFDALDAPGAETRLRCRRLWNQVRAPEPLATLGGQSGELRQVVFSPPTGGSWPRGRRTERSASGECRTLRCCASGACGSSAIKRGRVYRIQNWRQRVRLQTA